MSAERSDSDNEMPANSGKRAGRDLLELDSSKRPSISGEMLFDQAAEFYDQEAGFDRRNPFPLPPARIQARYVAPHVSAYRSDPGQSSSSTIPAFHPPVLAETLALPPGFSWRTGPRNASHTSTEPDDSGSDQMSLDDDGALINPAYNASHKCPKKGSRTWCMTLNSPSFDEFLELKSYASSDQILYGIIGREFRSRSHLQMYFRWKDAKTMSAIKKIRCFKSCWLGNARGTEGQCKAYNSKDGCWDEFHSENFAPGQGKRTDLTTMYERVRDLGEQGVQELIEEDPAAYVRYHAGIEALARRRQHKRQLTSQPLVIWVWGPSGSGKTDYVARLAQEHATRLESEIYELDLLNYKFIDGCKEQKV